MNQQGRFSSEVEAGIAGHLNQVRRVLEMSDHPAEEAEGILTDIESQIRSQLDAAAGTNARIPDLNATLARMDPPETYGGARLSGSRPLRAVSGFGGSILKSALALLIVVIVGLLIYYMMVDRRIASREDFSSDQPTADVPMKKDLGETEQRSALPTAEPVEQLVEAKEEPVADEMKPAVAQQQQPGAVPVAIASFSTSGNVRDSEAVRATVRDGLINALAFEENLRVVERAKLAEGLAELRMSAEGMIDQSTALKLGKIVGARVIITGNIVKIDDKLIITARLINAETSELAAARVTGGRAELLALVDELSQGIVSRIRKDEKGTLTRRAADTQAAEVRAKQKAVRQAIAGKELPRILVMIPETHLGGPVRDPAAETELVLWMTDCGFRVASPEYEGVHAPRPINELTSTTEIAFRRNRGLRNEIGSLNISSRALRACVTGGLGAERDKLLKIADVIVLGEGVSERGTQREGLVSCKARVELKAVDIRTGRVLLAKSTYGAGVDVAERIAGKRALQAAGRSMASELIPEIVNKWSKFKSD